MHYSEFTLTTTDNYLLSVRQWVPQQTPAAVIHILHGLAEHSSRYYDFAQYLTTQNMAVVAHDHRGHGKSVTEHQIIGFFHENDGWNRVISDVATVQEYIDQQFLSVPKVLLGHSMGSYIAQSFLINCASQFHGCILSGSNFDSLFLYYLLKVVAKLERLRQGKTGRSKIIDHLSFGTFNKAFKPARTKFDWLSRDETQVDLYINDPLCGQLSTNQLWSDLAEGLIEITRKKNLARIPADLPILITGGDHDPVSAGTRLQKLSQALRSSGLQSVDMNLYPQARHEILNETNRKSVYKDLSDWITGTLQS